MNKQIPLFILLIVLNVNFLHAQSYTNIPDQNFEQVLINQGIDAGIIDGKVLTASINKLTDLYIISKGISDLTGIQDFTALLTLNCSYNKLTTIDLSKNTNLKSLDCSSNQLSNLTLNSNINLNSLVCVNNQLSTLNIGANTALTTLNCSNNKLGSLDVSQNTLLTQLTCSANQLNALNTNALISLTLLNCSNNQLFSLNIANNTKLTNLFCASNQLSGLNLDANNALSLIDCSNNQIGTLNVGNNVLLKYLTCSSNLLGVINLAKNDSLRFLDIGNNQLSALDISGNDSVRNLICTSNKIKSIGFVNNKKIEKLDLSSNLIANLDLSSNYTIKSIDCSNNQLNALNVANGKNNLIATLIATKNPYLRCIIVDNPVSANSNANWQKDAMATYRTNCIAYTYVPDDKFEAALSAYDDIPNDNYVPTSNIESLITLNISNLDITNITGIEDFINLVTLNCAQNQLHNLDVSNLKKLTTLNCSSDSLVDLNLANGTNSLLTTMNAIDNKKLTCIKVDDITASKSGWTKDATAIYSLGCISNKTYIPDDNFEAELIELGYDKGALDNYVVTDSIKSLTKLDISSRNIFDLTGIGSFVALDTLYCSENKLDSINVSKNTKLKYLNCRGNFLTKLDVQTDTLLVNLSCGDNKLTTLNLTKNTRLEHLICNGNYLNNIVLDKDTSLMELNCNSNFFTNLNIDTNKKLKKLYCSDNKLTTILFTNNDSIQELDCSNNLIGVLNLQNTKQLSRLNCSVNNLINLDLSQDTALLEVKCNSNQITTLNLDKNTILRTIDCSNNKLTTISFANNDSIREISASNNKLSQLALNNMAFLKNLNITDNQIPSLNCSANDSLQSLLCSGNQLQSINLSKNLILNTLRCNNNLLGSLDISSNSWLKELNCSNNLITNINIGNALNLNELLIDRNKLSVLELSANISLIKVSCSNNLLTSLNFSSLINLKSMNCSSNQLSSLDGRNGKNSILETFYSSNNPKLQCIEIDDVSNIGASWVKDATATYTTNCHYSETYVPDDNFEAALSVIIGEPANNNDNYISTTSIKALTSINISNKNISDLTGLQDFTALTTLNCSGNKITSLNVNTNSNLTNLNCANNQIIQLDLSKNMALQTLDFSVNQINAVGLNNLAALTGLNAGNNGLISLDLRYNTNLTTANVSGNQLIDFHANNGNNAILTAFNATNNPALFCIEVDDQTAANGGSGVYATWLVDAIAKYGNNCHYNETYVPDDAFEQALKDLGYDNSGPLDDFVPTAKINKTTYLNIANKGISDMTGIEDFITLATLNCSNNNLSTLNLSENLALTTLIGSANNLSTLDVSKNSALKKLDITDNSLTNIDITSNLNLERLLCSINYLKSLNILNNKALIEINATSNQLLSVDANNGSNAILQNFDLRNNPELRCILVDDIAAANSHSGWYKDQLASYKLECNDDDNDGVIDSEDKCPDTPFGDFVDVFGCTIFRLPADNFTVLTKSETCLDGNNGIVNIHANEIYNYTATLTGTLDTVVFRFTNDADIRNIRADTYSLCITIDNKPGYSQCYQVVITQPDVLSVEAKIDNSGSQLNLKMSGGSGYTIDFNGFKFITKENEITLNLEKGKNSVQIMADAVCQGIYHETFFLSDAPSAFPNPFSNNLFLYSGENKANKVDVEIFSYSGQEVFSNTYQTDNGLVEIETTKLKPGIYYALIKTENRESTIKIVKQ